MRLVGFTVDDDILLQSWYSEDMDQEFYMDFNDFASFTCMLNILGVYDPGDIKSRWENLEVRKQVYKEIALDWLEGIIDDPGAFHYSFETTDDNIIVDVTGH